MKSHHKKHKAHHAKGGRTHEIVAGNPDVIHEAEDETSGNEEKKHGGKVKKNKGGKVIGLMTGGVARARLDRPGRKAGGRVGADKSPLSSAHKGSTDGTKLPASEDTLGGHRPD